MCNIGSKNEFFIKKKEKKTLPISQGLGLDLDAPSSLYLDSKLTDFLDLDLDLYLEREQRVVVSVWPKLVYDVMVDLLRPLSPIGVML